LPKYEYECDTCFTKQERVTEISEHHETSPCECGNKARQVFL